METSVFKFGGASVRDADAIRNMTEILTKCKEKHLLIVVSAMGKTTNGLEGILNAFYNKDGKAFELLEELKQKHFKIMLDLFEQTDEVFAQVNDLFVEIEWVIEEEPQDSYDYLYDQIVSVGELVSSKIVGAYLNKCGLTTTWLDVRGMILTDNTYREGQVQWKETEERIRKTVSKYHEQSNFVITQGFIGGTSENFTTTLGREGSDFTAAIFSYCMDAKSMSIWKDVPGILTGDPRLFDSVTKIDRLSYKEAIEMTYYGAKVIHPKTIKPLQNKNIPLYVKSFIDPAGEGTLITSDVEEQYPPVVVVEKEQVVLQIATRDFSFVAEHHLGYLFKLFAEHRIKINMMQKKAISFSVCATNIPERIAPLLEILKKDFQVHRLDNLELITVRHYHKDMLKGVLKGKMVLLEERIQNTLQMVVRDVPKMERKD